MQKIKVVFVINNFLVGGVERFLFDIISLFDKEKYDIKIITVFGSGPLEDAFQSLDIPIYFVSTSCPHVKNLLFSFFWILTLPVVFAKILFFFIKNKPDIIITSLYQADILGMTAAKIVGIKKRILIQHDIVTFGKFRYFLKKRLALNFSTQVVSVSNAVKSFLIEYFLVKEEKVFTIFNGINYEHFIKGRKVSLDLNSPVVGIVGRLEEVKGHIYALEAIKILKEKYNLSPDVLLAGDGSLRVGLEKYVEENKLDSVQFLGNVGNVPDFLSKIDILIIPSVTEGMPLVVLEGMVSGKAIIASNIKIMRELIKDNETGLLFKSQDSASLVEALLNTLSHKDFCEKLQKNTLLFTEQNKKSFDIQEVSKSYQNLLISK